MIREMNALAGNGRAFLFIIDFSAENGFLIPEENLDKRFIRFSFDNNFENKTVAENIEWEIKPVSESEYARKFAFVQQQIRHGNSFLVNLTQPTLVSTNLSLKDIYEHGAARYKLWLKDYFTVLSPECFVRVTDGKISSFPMKGTIDATLPEAENRILNDPKEAAEHATIVDLIRNDLSVVASNVEVKRYRYVEKIRTNKGEILQVSSEISGQLPENFRENLGEIIFGLLPAGSISGAPKKKTLEIIAEAEKYDRGFYTGIFGWYDGKNLDSAVMIRFTEKNENGLVYKSGGGITFASKMEKEYQELIQKVYVPVY